jgi:hypothetical protein
MRTIQYKKTGSKKEMIDGKKKYPIYDCRIKVDDETK